MTSRTRSERQPLPVYETVDGYVTPDGKRVMHLVPLKPQVNGLWEDAGTPLYESLNGVAANRIVTIREALKAVFSPHTTTPEPLLPYGVTKSFSFPRLSLKELNSLQIHTHERLLNEQTVLRGVARYWQELDPSRLSHIPLAGDISETRLRLFLETPPELSTEHIFSALETNDGAAIHQLLAYFEGASEAVHTYHQAGYIHRDIKQMNILTPKFNSQAPLQPADVMLIDAEFGAYIGTQDTLELDPNYGTPHYMPPETRKTLQQMYAGEIHGSYSKFSDLYALAVTYHDLLFFKHNKNLEMFTGSIPSHQFENLLRIMGYATDESPRKSLVGLTHIVRMNRFKKRLETFFNKALAEDPKKRFSTAPEMYAALKKILVSYLPTYP